MRIRTRIAVSTSALGLTLSGVATAPAYGDDTVPDVPSAVTGTLSPEEEEEVHRELDDAPKVDMWLNGQKVDPSSEDLHGAEVCAEVSEDGTMECFDTPEASNTYLARHAPTEASRRGAAEAATARRYQDCPSDWVCLWQHADYKGRRLQWPTYPSAKTRHLDQYSPSFRDKASSAYVNRMQRGVTLYDFRTARPDPKLILASGRTLWSNFKNYDYAYGGNWNDKADAIKF
ncbi:peptidase inhibitor family I36 protein [Streptomyces sp. NPDC017941]|uniref:peptidase inhibitor family I36 protein n=1 Tax=unclassified Streptomyces TaxID=2593676 RepID=UPI0037B07479